MSNAKSGWQSCSGEGGGPRSSRLVGVGEAGETPGREARLDLQHVIGNGLGLGAAEHGECACQHRVAAAEARVGVDGAPRRRRHLLPASGEKVRKSGSYMRDKSHRIERAHTQCGRGSFERDIHLAH